ncbi:MAG: ATP-binding cassette domain-containing protein [Burkholderiaceae bacterium]|nr:ATP-binding cassette domain-containing protein [Burkholderiaceae bacterium]
MIWDIDFAKQLRHGSSSFDLQVAFQSDAQRLVLFGPSGAGKTQTLKVVAGLVRADSGHVRIAGRTLFSTAQRVNLSPQRRHLAYVFQDYALFPHLSVRQNIAFGRRAGWTNPPRGVRHDAVDRWIETFNLQSVADHHPHQVSGGQRQRTALARALMNDPTALLLDEPFSALDKGLRQRLREDLARLQRKLEIPMLMITHDDDDVRLLADEVVHLRAGRVAPAADAREAEAA